MDHPAGFNVTRGPATPRPVPPLPHRPAKVRTPPPISRTHFSPNFRRPPARCPRIRNHWPPPLRLLHPPAAAVNPAASASAGGRPRSTRPPLLQPRGTSTALDVPSTLTRAPSVSGSAAVAWGVRRAGRTACGAACASTTPCWNSRGPHPGGGAGDQQPG